MFYYLISLISFLAVQVFLHNFSVSEREKVYIPPSKKVVHFTFGYDDFVSSLMWVRLVQDFHICDQTKEKSVYPSPNKDMDPIADALTRELPKSTCENGWVFQMLDVISDVTPDFTRVYLDGGTMLSVMVDDREGAQKIFDKGRVNYPDNWEILYRAAYHELFEMQDGEKAAELMIQAGKRGAPSWVYSLAAKLHTRFGKAALAKSILVKVLERDQGGKYKARLEAQLKKVDDILRQGENAK